MDKKFESWNGVLEELNKMRKRRRTRYAVYVAELMDYARVHNENCRYYKKRKSDESDTGYWKAGFRTKEDALNYAKGTGKRKVDICNICLKLPP